MNTVRLACIVTGRLLCEAGFIDAFTNAASWVRDYLAERFECAAADISIGEDDDGRDVAIIAGNVVAEIIRY